MNTKIKGNKAEAVVLAEFVKNNLPVLLPFGDNEKYDLVFELNKEFKTVQVKYGRIKNNCVIADIRYRIGFKRVKYKTYYDKVDFIAIWCEENNKIYLINLKDFGNKNRAILRLNPPKNNSSVSKVFWAVNYEINKVINTILL